MEFAMILPPNHAPQAKIHPWRVKKSTSDRPGDAQEQPKSPDKNKFHVFFEFLVFWGDFVEALDHLRRGQEVPRGA